MKHNKGIVSILIVLLLLSTMIPAIRVLGSAQPITDTKDKLEGISQEEKKSLETLFTLSQKIIELEQEEAVLSDEIETMKNQIADLESEIEEKQQDYDMQLEIFENVLVHYQRGGPASYLEILLNAKDLTEFLKRINLIKDFSRNLGDLLDSLQKGKKVLEDENTILKEKVQLLVQKKSKLLEHMEKTQALKQEQEDYLKSLQEEQVYYQEQLDNLVTLWNDCTVIFGEISKEITRIIGEGYFTPEDLNLSFGFTKMQGAINGEFFNQIIKKNSTLPETIFRFHEEQVIIEVPEKHLILTGKFIIASDSSIQYKVDAGTFYDMPLEAASIKELFKDGPLLIDFKTISGDLVIIDFILNWIRNEEGQLAFEIKPIW